MAYTVTNVQDEQQVDPNTGNVQNLYDVTFTLSDHPGTFEVTAPKTGTDVVGTVQAAIEARVAEIEGIYGLTG